MYLFEVKRNFPFFLKEQRGEALRTAPVLPLAWHVVCGETQSRGTNMAVYKKKKGEYDVVKHLKYNNISIYFFCECESAIISILSMKYMHLCLLACQWNTP